MKKPICINIYRKGISFFSTIIFEKGIKYTKEYSKEKLFYMKKEIEMIVGKNQIKDFLKDYENIVIARDDISPTIIYIIIIDMLVSFERWLVQ